MVARDRLARLLPDPGPGRLLVFCTAVASLGNGLYVTGGAVYFVHVVGLSAGQVGLALSIAGVISLPIGLPVGYLADRFGARGTTAVLALGKAAALVMAAFVQSFTAYLLVALVHGVAEHSGHVARSALVSGVMGREGRVRISAYMRSVFNGGFAVASLASGVIIALDSRPAYLALFWGNAIAMVAVAGLYMRLPAVPGKPRPARRQAADQQHPTDPARKEQARKDRARTQSAIRDLPYLVVAQVSGIVRIGPTALALGVPLWLVTHTDAPRAMAAWLMLINTLMVVFLQVYVARGADTVPGAARLQRWTLLTLGAGCVAAAFTGQMPGWAAAVMLAFVAVLFSLGEIWGEAARWGLRYELAPDHAQGQYGGVFATGDAIALIAGPLLVTTVPDQWGALGWLLLTGLFLGSLTLSGPAVRWAMRTRPAPAVRTDHTDRPDHTDTATDDESISSPAGGQ